MKPFSGSIRFAWPRSNHEMILCLALALGTALWVAGCGKKESAPVPVVPSATATNQQGVPPEVKVEMTSKTEAKFPVVQQLNRAMLRYRRQNGRNPASVEELASAAGIQLPEPPPGKKYAINKKGIVVLMDNSAK